MKKFLLAIAIVCGAVSGVSAQDYHFNVKLADGTVKSYDPNSVSSVTFSQKADASSAATVSYQYVNATNYANWVYFNLHQKDDSATVNYQTEYSGNWDIALHRYDIKTNNGAAYETSYESLETLKSDIADGTFTIPASSQLVKDNPNDSIMTGLSMAEGKMYYNKSSKNDELGKWLTLNMASMPPVYTLSGKVYIIALSDGTYAAFKGNGFRDASGRSGNISFDYLYPITVSRSMNVALANGNTDTYNTADVQDAELSAEEATATVAGTYTGYSRAVFAYAPDGMYTDGEVVDITLNDDGTANVHFNSQAWGETTLEGVSVTETDDSYVLGKKEGTILMGMGQTKSSYVFILDDATISKDKSTFTFTFEAPAVMGGTTIVVMNGTAPASSKAQQAKAKAALAGFLQQN